MISTVPAIQDREREKGLANACCSKTSAFLATNGSFGEVFKPDGRFGAAAAVSALLPPTINDTFVAALTARIPGAGSATETGRCLINSFQLRTPARKIATAANAGNASVIPATPGGAWVGVLAPTSTKRVTPTGFSTAPVGHSLLGVTVIHGHQRQFAASQSARVAKGAARRQ